MTPDRSPKIFISYDRKDQEYAERLRKSLKGSDVDVWLDIEKIAPGAIWREAVENAIRQADIVTILIGWNPSDRVQSEAEEALREYEQKGSPQIVPILLPGSEYESLPFLLRGFPVIDFRQHGINTRSLRSLLARVVSDPTGALPDYELVADRLRNAGDPHTALSFYRKALENRRTDASQLASDEAALRRKIGTMLVELGDSARARVEFEKSLIIHERLFGSNHPEVAIDLSNLGSLYYDLGNMQSAGKNFKRALDINRKALDSMDPLLSPSMTNLGNVLRRQGDMLGAQDLFQEALVIDEAAYGPDAPAVATDFMNLGGLTYERGELDTARSLFERALTINESAYGTDHPEVSKVLNNLGSVLYDMGDLVDGEALLRRALRIDEATYGPDHPDVAARLGNLGNILHSRGDSAAALKCFERALLIDERALA